jgi:hypothetical protein
MGQNPAPEAGQGALQAPYIRGRVVAVSAYPAYPLSYAEVTLAWNSLDSTTYADSDGGFAFYRIPRNTFTLHVTTFDFDTVTVAVDLTTVDTAYVEVGLTQVTGFVPGELIVGFRDTTGLRSLVVFAEMKNLPIKDASHFSFVTDSLSADSAQSIKNLLTGKPYLSGGSIRVAEDRVTVSRFKNMSLAYLQDWEATSYDLGFHESKPTFHKLALLTVAPGSETSWIPELSAEPMVDLVSLNGVVTIFDRLPPNQQLNLTE